MNFANLSLPWLLAGAAALAGLLYVLQQLRIRYTEVAVPTAMFWREAARDAPVRVFRRRFRHWLAYLLSLLICWLLWLGLAEPRVEDPEGGQYHVLFLDGSAHMSAPGDLDQAIRRLRDDLRNLPQDRREVIWGGAWNLKLLNAGEESLLFDRRVAGLAPEARPRRWKNRLTCWRCRAPIRRRCAWSYTAALRSGAGRWKNCAKACRSIAQQDLTNRERIAGSSPWAWEQPLPGAGTRWTC